MPIPDFQSIMLPLLKQLGDGKEYSNHEIVDKLAQEFSLTEQELAELLPSGKQAIFYNRVGWAKTHLAKSLLLEMPRRSYNKITARGVEVLKSNPARIDMKFLEQFPEYIKFQVRKGTPPKPKDTNHGSGEGERKTPEEMLESAYQEIRANLAQDLLDQVKKSPPDFFERLVVELLVNMGYGGSRREAARAIGKTGDEGIDGIIDEDKLGLDTIYIQAKRWESVVGRPEIQKFVGALMGKRARKGIFITTSSFSSEAKHYVSTIDFNVILIDGERLTEFMIDYNVGVTETISYQLKRIDSDYFNSE